MKKLKRILLAVAVIGLASACSTGHRSSDKSSSVEGGSGYRRVGRVSWRKTEQADALKISNESVPSNATSVFFYRSKDDRSTDGFQSSANVAINDRFQVSLQPGHFSHVYSCSGINDVSVEITGNKSNNLKYDASAYDLQAGNSYYFEVKADDAGAKIKQVPKSVALQAMDGMSRQSHQISRVVPNCAPGASRIQLQVLFDTDKHDVKQEYYPEIERVAAYMKQHPKTTAVLEGYTDNRQTEAYNLSLSQRRVDEVMRILVENYGISANRLKAVGYGESRPIAPNDSPANMQKNRRVMAVFSYE